MKNDLILSKLNHTWILDIDGTIAKHNGYKIDGEDSILPGVREFFDRIDKNDMIIFLTSRTNEYKEETEKFLKRNSIRYDYIIYGVPFGERIIINDSKPSGLEMSKAVSLQRDSGMTFRIDIDDAL